MNPVTPCPSPGCLWDPGPLTPEQLAVALEAHLRGFHGWPAERVAAWRLLVANVDPANGWP